MSTAPTRQRSLLTTALGAALLGIGVLGMSIFADSAADASAPAAHDGPFSPQDFASGMRIDTPRESAAYRLTLPLAVYQGTVREDLGDLRIFNLQGETVPYSLMQVDPPPPLHATTLLPLFPLRGAAHAAMDGLKLTIESPGSAVRVLQTQGSAANGGEVRQYLLDARGIDAKISSLQLAWPDSADDYSGRLTLEVSDDLGAWTTVISGAPIANLHANGQSLVANRIEVAPTRAKFWRLSWANSPPAFELKSVTADTADRPETVYASLGVGGMVDPSDSHAYTFDLGAHAPITRLNLTLPESNSLDRVELSSRRTPGESWRTRIVADVYRISTSDGERSNTPIDIEMDHARYWRARILNGGDLSRTPPHLVVSYVPAEITFLAQGRGPFLLAYGSVTAPPAETDLSRLSRATDIGSASVGTAQVLGGPSRRALPSAAFSWVRALLWIVLIVAALLLGWMAFRLSKDPSA
jgi:hypothetical protein